MSTHPTKKLVLRRILRELYAPAAEVRWGAVRDLGRLAEEKAAHKTRELLRRLAWSLNEESGATGWGAPEAMGEIMARAPEHRVEFGGHLLGYLSDRETYLDNPVLDGGTLWALGRLGRGERFDVDSHVEAVGRFIGHPDPAVRGLAAWAASRLDLPALHDRLGELAGDDARLWILLDGRVVQRTVADLARA